MQQVLMFYGTNQLQLKALCLVCNICTADTMPFAATYIILMANTALP